MNSKDLIAAATSTEDVMKAISAGNLKTVEKAVKVAKKELLLKEAEVLTAVFTGMGGSFRKPKKVVEKSYPTKVRVTLTTKNDILNDLVVGSLNRLGGLLENSVDAKKNPVMVYGLEKAECELFLGKMKDVAEIKVEKA